MQEYVLLFIFFKILHGGIFTAGNACTVLYCIVPDRIVLCCIALSCVALCCVALRCVVLCCNVLCCVLKNCINRTSIFHNHPQRHVKRKVHDFQTLLTSSMFTILDKW